MLIGLLQGKLLVIGQKAESNLMSSDDARNLAIVVGTFVAALTLAKAVFEYSRQNAQKRAEYYLELREKYQQKDRFADIFELLDNNSPKLAELPHYKKLYFLSFYEDIALLVNAGLMKQAVAHYMFGNYAIRCWESEYFWENMNRNDPYWLLFRHFVQEMKRAEKNLLKRPKSVWLYRL
jgi:hypothetical protein